LLLHVRVSFTRFGNHNQKPENSMKTTDNALRMLGLAPLVFAATLQAQFTAYQIPDGTVGNQNFAGPVGVDFDVLSPIYLTGLGVFDSASDGLDGTEAVYIWQLTSPTTGTLLTSTNFDAGDGVLVGGYRVKPLAEKLRLNPGSYVLSADGYASIYNTHGISTNFLGPAGAGAADDAGGLIAFVGTSRFQSPPTAAGSFPNTIDGGPAYRASAGTFQFLAVDGRKTFDNTKTRQALPMDVPPVIDGVIDAGEWDQAYSGDWRVIYDANAVDGIRGGNFGDVSGPLTGAADLGFQIWAGYDSTNLYIRVRVTDDVISSDTVEADSANGTFWVDDAVEVFIDGDNSNNLTRNSDIYVDAGKASTNSFQFAITANNGYFEWQTFSNPAGTSAYGVDKAWFARTSPLADGTGYEAEFRISLLAIGNPKPGDIIGFNVAVDDDDDGGGIERQVHWSGVPHVESSWGNLLLGRRSYDAPKTTAAPTIDGTIAPGEYAGAAKIQINPYTAIYDIGSGDEGFSAFPLGDNGYSAWVVHDADAIYVAVDVLDDQLFTDTAPAGSEDMTTWEDDSVEIFFDVDLDRLGGRETAFEGQYVFTANGAWRDMEAGSPTFGAANDWFAATSTNARGYQVEFKIKKSALNDPADGATLGFHIAQNDDDGSGRRAQVGWSGRAHNENTYGTLTLAGSAQPPPTTPTVSIARTPTGVTVTFTGELQSADQVKGPYTTVANAISPLPVTPNGSTKFYRSVIR